ncbi:MAG: hypothetical protein HY909_00720 [Deltaproteobacteria bacterium]|nr:hypothetical protein [Deltaproteobacteria bacterium]
MTFSPELLNEIDVLYEAIAGMDHYGILGVDRQADRPTILNAHQTRARRFRPLPSPLPPEYRPKVDALLRALDDAVGVLAEPTRRCAYDQTLPPLRRHSSRPPARPSSSAIAAAQPGDDAGLLQAVMHSLLAAPSEPTPPTTLASPMAPRPSTPPPRPPTLHAAVVSAAPTPVPHGAPPGPEDRRVRILERQVEGLHREVSGLYSELEKVTATLQLCVAELSREHSPRLEPLQGAAQVLLGTRAELALRLAQREVEAGRWDQAQTLWQKALRARNDAPTHVQIADCIRRHDGDLGLAEDYARRAVALDPDLPGAQACLAIISAMREAAPR